MPGVRIQPIMGPHRIPIAGSPQCLQVGIPWRVPGSIHRPCSSFPCTKILSKCSRLERIQPEHTDLLFTGPAPCIDRHRYSRQTGQRRRPLRSIPLRSQIPQVQRSGILPLTPGYAFMLSHRNDISTRVKHRSPNETPGRCECTSTWSVICSTTATWRR